MEHKGETTSVSQLMDAIKLLKTLKKTNVCTKITTSYRHGSHFYTDQQ